ncbi:MAG: hypothetical protein ACI4MT_05710 [Christensenellales bacterium]
MIEEVILDVKRAEEEAASIAEKSIADAKEITVKAEIAAAAMRKKATSEIKEALKTAIAKAEEEAEANRAAIIEQGLAGATALSDSKKKEADEVADFIVDTFIKKF